MNKGLNQTELNSVVYHANEANWHANRQTLVSIRIPRQLSTLNSQLGQTCGLNH